MVLQVLQLFSSPPLIEKNIKEKDSRHRNGVQSSAR